MSPSTMTLGSIKLGLEVGSLFPLQVARMGPTLPSESMLASFFKPCRHTEATVWAYVD